MRYSLCASFGFASKPAQRPNISSARRRFLSSEAIVLAKSPASSPRQAARAWPMITPKPLRARLAGHAVGFQPRERQHPARAAHMALVRGGKQRRVAVRALLHREHGGAVRLHRLETAHDQFEQPVAHALAGIERVRVVGDRAVERLFDAIHRLAERGAVEVRQRPARRLRQFRQRDLTPRALGRRSTAPHGPNRDGRQGRAERT